MCGIALFWRQIRAHRVVLALSLVILATTLLAVLPRAVQAEERASLPPAPDAPTAAGAPFLPSVDHTESVAARAGLLMQIDQVDQARNALLIRRNAPETMRILDSQHAALSRDLGVIEGGDLASPTSAFGIEVGVFPVDELRKPFHNDWDEPRSGGRRHRGTDLLAQMNVPLRAIEDGTFERTTQGSLGGLSVYLLGDSGSRYYYAHLEEVEPLVEGQRLYAGQLVGRIGDSGNAAGSPHLHMQWDPDGGSNWQNPFPLLDALYGDGAFIAPDAFGPPNALR